MGHVARLVWCILTAMLAFSGPARAQEQAFPNKPVRMMVTAAAGGITDIMARLIQEKVGRGLGQPLIVDNKPGAGGVIATDYVAKAAPDGYTVVIVNVGNVAIAPWLNKALPYDPLNDLVGVAAVAEVPSVVAINDKLPVRTLKEFIEYARANPGKINYGSAGNGTIPHLAAEVLSRLTGIKMVHVPYKGMGPASVDLAAGRIQLGLIGIGSAKGQIAAGQVRVLGVAGSRRLTVMPDMPTFDEGGVPGYDVTNWFGVMAPKGTPRDVVELLNRQIGEAAEDPPVVQKLAAAGILPMREPVEQFQKRVNADYAKWRDIVREAGVKIQ